MQGPFFREVMTPLSDIINYDDKSLFIYIFNSIEACQQFQLNCTVASGSNVKTLTVDQGRIDIDICKELGATEYKNPEGGRHLYSEIITRSQFSFSSLFH